MDAGAGVIAAPAIGWADTAGPTAVVTVVESGGSTGKYVSE